MNLINLFITSNIEKEEQVNNTGKASSLDDSLHKDQPTIITKTIIYSVAFFLMMLIFVKFEEFFVFLEEFSKEEHVNLILYFIYDVYFKTRNTKNKAINLLENQTDRLLESTRNYFDTIRFDHKKATCLKTTKHLLKHMFLILFEKILKIAISSIFFVSATLPFFFLVRFVTAFELLNSFFLEPLFFVVCLSFIYFLIIANIIISNRLDCKKILNTKTKEILFYIFVFLITILIVLILMIYFKNVISEFYSEEKKFFNPYIFFQSKGVIKDIFISILVILFIIFLCITSGVDTKHANKNTIY